MQDLAGKSAFITGAASGIGLAMARSFAREGVAIAIADIDLEAAETARKDIESAGGRAVAIQCDVTSRDSVEAAADHATHALGPIHLAVNNAGAFTAAEMSETFTQDWEWILAINVMGVVNGIHTFLPRMRAHGEGGHIINTASISGHIPVVGLSIYTASKYAVVGLSECLSLELADENIDVSIVCPGIVKTGLVETSARHRPDKHGGPMAASDERLDAIIETGTDPAILGDRVVEGVRKGELYIFTHPELRAAVQNRHQAILDAY